MAKKKTKTTRTTKKPRKRTSFKLSKQQKVIFGSFLFFLGLALIFSFISYFFNWQADQSNIGDITNRELENKNWLNTFGNNVGHFFIYKGFGVAAFIFAFLLTLSGIYYFFDYAKLQLRKFWFWGLLVMIWLSVFFGFFSSNSALLSGVIGFEINDVLQDYLGLIGTILVMAFLAIIYFVIRLKITPDKVSAALKNTKKEIASDFSSEENKENAGEENISEIIEDTTDSKPVEIDLSGTSTDISSEEKKLEPVLTSEKIVIKPSAENDVAMEVEQAVEEEEVTQNLSDKLVSDFGEFDPKLELSKYKFPTINLLKDYAAGASITIDQEELEEHKNKIVETLNNYKIGIANIKATVGPTVTLYEIIPEAGVRISKIKNLEDDIALSLSALGIRIIAPIPGRGTIGIEVPNKKPCIVSMRSVIASPKFQKAEMELPLALGKTISNETFVVDLAKMPHLLMAGATGQGKSVGLNAILTSLLYKKHPAEVKFVLVDPKKVELTLFNKI